MVITAMAAARVVVLLYPYLIFSFCGDDPARPQIYIPQNIIIFLFLCKKSRAAHTARIALAHRRGRMKLRTRQSAAHHTEMNHEMKGFFFHMPHAHAHAHIPG